MPVDKSQRLVLVDYPEKGVNTNLDPNTVLQGETTLTVSCESPTCDSKISWVLETAGENAEGVPDDAFRILILEEFGGQKHVFCSWDCMRRAMKNYVPPLSPREQAQIDEHNAKIAPKGNELAQVKELLSEAENLGFEQATSVIVPSPQADGFSGETSE